MHTFTMFASSAHHELLRSESVTRKHQDRCPLSSLRDSNMLLRHAKTKSQKDEWILPLKQLAKHSALHVSATQWRKNMAKMANTHAIPIQLRRHPALNSMAKATRASDRLEMAWTRLEPNDGGYKIS